VCTDGCLGLCRRSALGGAPALVACAFVLELSDVLEALAGPRLTIDQAKASRFMASRGLYAVYASADVWRRLRLGPPPDDRPLYSGKSESTFQTREFEDHFGVGRTGRSTLRRSFAALLRDDLDLEPVPRGQNPLDRTTRATMYALRPRADERLSSWMRENLTLALWPSSQSTIVALRQFEKDVIAQLKPPLCIDGKWKPNHWHAEVIEPARRAMTSTVRSSR
jgi:hypothetical protein